MKRVLERLARVNRRVMCYGSTTQERHVALKQLSKDVHDALWLYVEILDQCASLRRENCSECGGTGQVLIDAGRKKVDCLGCRRARLPELRPGRTVKGCFG